MKNNKNGIKEKLSQKSFKRDNSFQRFPHDLLVICDG